MSVFKKEEYLIGITNAMGIFCHRVSLENTLHLFNTNTMAEDFFASLLNFIYGWDLNNINAEEMNASAIDLADRDQKIAVQVTVERTAAKVRKTIQKFVENGLYLTYVRLIILQITLNKGGHKASYCDDTNELFSFSNASDILDMKDIVLSIGGLSDNKIEEIYEFINKQTDLTNGIKPKHSHLCTFIEALSQAIDADENPVSYDFKSFDIENKIEYNSLIKYRSIVDDYGEYMSACESAFASMEGYSRNSKSVVLRWVNEQYLEIKREILSREESDASKIEIIRKNSDLMIDLLNEKIKTFLREHADYTSLSVEEMEICGLYFICYAFCQCKVLERPV